MFDNAMGLLQREDISYLNSYLFDADGEFIIRPYKELKDIPQLHLALFGHDHALYTIPTVELIEFLDKQIAGKKDKTIEIGAGAGIISKALGIVATDSFMQAEVKYKALYEIAKQPTVKYGKHVLKYDALSAVREFKPQIVIGSYCTHKFNPKEYWREGNEVGIDEEKLLSKVKKYIHIGNEVTHGKKKILQRDHITASPEWLITRKHINSKNVIWIWS